jgi:hypothetical protein
LEKRRKTKSPWTPSKPSSTSLPKGSKMTAGRRTSNRRGDDGEDTVEDEEDEEIEGDIIKVDPKFVKQSSELYKKFLEGQ